MAGENKAFPGLMEVLQDFEIPNKKSSLLYKIGNLTNISKISLQTRMAPSWKDEKKSTKKNNERNERKKKKEKSRISLRPAGTSVFFISSSQKKQKTKKFQTRVPSYSAIS